MRLDQAVYPVPWQEASQGHGEKEVSGFISHLAVERRVASSTQNQALNAIVFLYKRVLRLELGEFGTMVRAKKPKRLPVVLSQEETRRVLLHLFGEYKLMAQLCHAPAQGRLRHPHGAGASIHENVQTTMIYTHVTQQRGRGFAARSIC